MDFIFYNMEFIFNIMYLILYPIIIVVFLKIKIEVLWITGVNYLHVLLNICFKAHVPFPTERALFPYRVKIEQVHNSVGMISERRQAAAGNYCIVLHLPL